MADVIEHTLKAVDTGDATNAREFVLKRYDDAIRYYWKSSTFNRRLYKWSRYLVVVFGAAVTLLASIATSSMITGTWSTVVGVVTPIVAAALTIIGGLSQSFQWGAAWQEMVLSAERLERERDRIMVTRSDPIKDLEVLHSLVLQESEGFFTRILGSVQTTVRDKEPKPRDV
jgi:ABC-type multidrug transport system fused ATPase/permease subunit